MIITDYLTEGWCKHLVEADQASINGMGVGDYLVSRPTARQPLEFHETAHDDWGVRHYRQPNCPR